MGSHLDRSDVEECGRAGPPLHVGQEALLTNGHARLVNGALKLEESSSDAGGASVGPDLCGFSQRKAAGKPQGCTEQPDPYEFPHSPLREQEQSSSPGDQPSNPPPPSLQEAGTSAENHLPVPHRALKSPLRVNGCHGSTSARPSERASRSGQAPGQLLEQTGGLISEFYSHSRLHQISTWRTSFSEYVNELHSRRKTAGASFPGKERLRKSAAQQDGQGRRGGVRAPLGLEDVIY